MRLHLRNRNNNYYVNNTNIQRRNQQQIHYPPLPIKLTPLKQIEINNKPIQNIKFLDNEINEKNFDTYFDLDYAFKNNNNNYSNNIKNIQNVNNDLLKKIEEENIANEKKRLEMEKIMIEIDTNLSDLNIFYTNIKTPKELLENTIKISLIDTNYSSDNLKIFREDLHSLFSKTNLYSNNLGFVIENNCMKDIISPYIDSITNIFMNCLSSEMKLIFDLFTNKDKKTIFTNYLINATTNSSSFINSDFLSSFDTILKSNNSETDEVKFKNILEPLLNKITSIKLMKTPKESYKELYNDTENSFIDCIKTFSKYTIEKDNFKHLLSKIIIKFFKNPIDNCFIIEKGETFITENDITILPYDVDLPCEIIDINDSNKSYCSIPENGLNFVMHKKLKVSKGHVLVIGSYLSNVEDKKGEKREIKNINLIEAFKIIKNKNTIQKSYENYLIEMIVALTFCFCTHYTCVKDEERFGFLIAFINLIIEITKKVLYFDLKGTISNCNDESKVKELLDKIFNNKETTIETKKEIIKMFGDSIKLEINDQLPLENFVSNKISKNDLQESYFEV
jgi:hypothetical protein